MKRLNRLSKSLRMAGIALITIAVILTIYMPVNTASYWYGFSGALKQSGVNTSIIDRLRYDSSFFASMSYCAAHQGEIGREENVADKFSYFSERAASAESELSGKRFDDCVQYLTDTLDSTTVIERYERVFELKDATRATEAIAALNDFATPRAANGKKLPAKKNSSVEPFFTEAYANACEIYGAELGSYGEFLSTLVTMITEENNNGADIKDAAAWYESSFDYEAYTLARSATDPEDDSETLLDRYVACVQSEAPDYTSFLHESYAALQRIYPDEQLPGEDVYATAVIELLESPAYDGNTESEHKAVLRAADTLTESSFDSYMKTMSAAIVANADARAGIGIVSLFWAIVSKLVLIWIIAIALIIIAALLYKIMNKVLIRRIQNSTAAEPTDDDVLLRVEHLKQYFRSGEYINKAVDDVSFTIRKGEVFGLVGESGCGKTTTGRTIINLYDPTEGDVYFHGLRISSTLNGLGVLKRAKRAALKEATAAMMKDSRISAKERSEKIAELKRVYHEEISNAEMRALESEAEKAVCVERYREMRVEQLTREYEEDMKKLSGSAAEERKQRYETERKVARKDNIMTKMQMIFQDPIASINPRMTVREIIAEGLAIRGVRDKKYIDDKVNEMLELVGLVREHADRYPHEFSGGQRQRIGIARAIVLQPDLIIADEPISALDVSIQAQVINLMNNLRKDMGLTIMFIAHNLSVVKYFSDRIGVMYFGKLVELADSDELFKHPLHPYTKSLLSAIPYPDPYHEKNRKRVEYHPELVHDYKDDLPSLREIVPGHFIHCNDAEFEMYKKELSK